MSEQTTQRMVRQAETRPYAKKVEVAPSVARIPLAYHPVSGELLCKRRADWLALPDAIRLGMVRANMEAKKAAQQAFAFWKAQASAIEPAAVPVPV